MSDSPTDVYGPRGGPFTDNYGKEIFLACEKVSACCWKPVDETGACTEPKCHEHNGTDCLTHEKPWDGDEECRR